MDKKFFKKIFLIDCSVLTRLQENKFYQFSKAKRKITTSVENVNEQGN